MSPVNEPATSGRWYIAAAAVLWSSSGLFAKSPIFDAWSPEARGPMLAFWRALFAALVLLPLVRRPRWSPKLVPLAVAFAVMSVTYLSAMTLTTAANAIWLQSTAPWWVFLLGTLLARQKVARLDLIPLLCAGFGVGLILFHEMQGQARAGILCGLAAGVSYAVVVLLMHSLHWLEATWLVALNLLITAAILLPYNVHLNHWPDARQLALLAAFGIVQLGLPYVLFARGLQAVSSQEATCIGLLEPLLLPLWVYLAWGEVPAWWTLCGGALIFAGLAQRYARPTRSPE